eukprot:NODE_4835_length_1840_cov_10.939288.p1 GENE.NODE_4835_length_1840_cov_10.939288~~NODE_4835_length_1840_cov_10.939288.p1  ORF type:complete len:399 (-),score=116.44 NODE_4835_length_1840_cov_10.939288:539-1735(-)
MCKETVSTQSTWAEEAAHHAEMALAAIVARTDDLEGMILTAVTSAQDSSVQTFTPRSSGLAAQVKDAPCIAAEGSVLQWHPGRAFLNDTGLAFERAADIVPPSGAEAASTTSSSKDMQMFPWAEILSIDSLDTGPSSLMRGIDLQLRSAPGRLRLQFSDRRPLEAIRTLWETARAGGGVPEEVDVEMEQCPFLAEFRRHAGAAARPPMERAMAMPFPEADAMLSELHLLLRAVGEECVIMRYYKTMGAYDIRMRPWEKIADNGGYITRLHMMLPLDPRPMAPKQTRLTIVYHLSEDGVNPIVLTDMSKSLDVPYSESFLTHSSTVIAGPNMHATVSSKDSPPLLAGQIATEKLCGVAWLGRCIVKGLVERAVRDENAVKGQRFVNILAENLRNARADP